MVVEFGVIKDPPQQNVGVEEVAHSHCFNSSSGWGSKKASPNCQVRNRECGAVHALSLNPGESSESSHKVWELIFGDVLQLLDNLLDQHKLNSPVVGG